MNSRLIAAQILYRVVKEGQSLTVALDNSLANIADAKDRAFIQVLCYGVCRYYYRLEFILNQLLSKPLRNKELDIKLLALLGLYQLQYMRVKPHAAVSETVAAIKKKSWAKSLVNAVLRNYLRQQTELEQQADKDLLASSSHPQWLISAIQQDWNQQAAKIFDENNQQPPMTLRVNCQQGDRVRYLQKLAEQDIAAQALAHCDVAIQLEKPVVVELLPNFDKGEVSVQDQAAQLASELLELQAGQRVLDVCAAPGGKTAHILETQPDLAELIAIDIDEKRLARVEENLQRLQLTARCLAADATTPEKWWDGKPFQRILLDAPCSALGVIRRHPDIKLLRRETDIAALQTLQQEILQANWKLLATGGILVYATCSILKQENELQIKQFLAEHDDAEERVINADWGIACEHGRQIMTGDSGMDGFYYARLRKK